MPTNLLTAARKHLSDAQLIAFLREAARDHHPRAMAILCGEVDKGRSLDEIAAKYSGERPGALALDLKVKRKRANVYAITCGFRGALVGDGGTFTVVYDAKGALISAQQEGFWMC